MNVSPIDVSMALETHEQINKLLEDKKHILITFGKNAGGDALASATALFLFFANLGKNADMVSHEFALPKQYEFLKNSQHIQSRMADLKTFILTLDVKDTGVQELSYDLVSDKLRIFVTPKEGMLNKEHLKTAESSYKYDLIISLGTQDLSALGPVYDQHPELFEKTPVINIDFDSSNEHYGHINLIDITATSVAEMLFDLFKRIGNEYIDSDVATALLTGMISRTHSFKAENVRPHTLAIAGKLINLGADRDYIVDNLYRTRTIAALRLWGEALSHLHIEKDLGLVTTSITRDDFVRSGAHKHDLEDIVDELISNSPEAKLTLLLFEDPDSQDTIHATLATTKGYDAYELLKGYNALGNKNRSSLTMRNKTLKEVEEKLLEHLKKEIVKRYQ